MLILKTYPEDWVDLFDKDGTLICSIKATSHAGSQVKLAFEGPREKVAIVRRKAKVTERKDEH